MSEPNERGVEADPVEWQAAADRMALALSNLLSRFEEGDWKEARAALNKYRKAVASQTEQQAESA